MSRAGVVWGTLCLAHAGGSREVLQSWEVQKAAERTGLAGCGVTSRAAKLGGDAKVLVAPWECATLNDQALLKVFKPPGAWVG